MSTKPIILVLIIIGIISISYAMYNNSSDEKGVDSMMYDHSSDEMTGASCPASGVLMTIARSLNNLGLYEIIFVPSVFPINSFAKPVQSTKKSADNFPPFAVTI